MYMPIRTKIEFSRRTDASSFSGTAFEATEREVLRAYALTPILATHYRSRAAIIQKIHALAARAEPQARDVFDLNLLLAREETEEIVLDTPERAWLDEAIEHALGISHAEYTSKVVAYLDPQQAAPFAEPDSWDAMQQNVVMRLEQMKALRGAG